MATGTKVSRRRKAPPPSFKKAAPRKNPNDIFNPKARIDRSQIQVRKRRKGHPRFTRDVRRLEKMGRDGNGYIDIQGGGKYWNKVGRRANKRLVRFNKSKGKAAFDSGRQFSPAQSEDSIGYWDGKKRGNKQGKSYTTDSNGRTTYTKPRRKNRSKPNKRGNRAGKGAFNAGYKAGGLRRHPVTGSHGYPSGNYGGPTNPKALKSKRKKAAVNRIRQRSSSGKRIV